MQKFDVGYNWKRFKEVDRMIIEKGNDNLTEADLCKYIYSKFGEGRFMILAWKPRHEGFFCFWLGNLYSNGFIRDVNKNKDLSKLKEEAARAKSYEEREMLEEDMDFEREIAKEMPKTTRGPIGIFSFKPGQLHAYDEIHEKYREKIQ